MKDRATVGVTGTPGTGKKSVAPVLAGSLRARLIDINAVALAGGKPGAREVEVNGLRRALLRLDLSHAILFGHLLPDVLRKEEVDFVAVMRCEPAVLKKRLLARGYPARKVLDNVEAELIGLVLDASVRTFGERCVHEYDATAASALDVARKVARDLKTGAGGASPWIDWTVRYDSSAKLRSLLSMPRMDPAST